VNQQRPIIICLSNPAEALDEIARERIFEPFYTTKPEGTGLGLPIAYQTVASNGGILEVECEGGEIQFWVRLPTESPRSKTASRILPRIRRDPVRTPEE
jgi:signal transduction histidine kinase